MKKHGFTLIELMGVIIVIGLVFLLIIPSIDKVLNNSREELFEKQIDSIKLSARLWMSDSENKELLSKNETWPYIITLGDLQNGDYIGQIKNPKNNSILSPNTIIEIYENDVINVDITIDSDAPYIILNGDAVYNIELNSDSEKYVELGAKAYTDKGIFIRDLEPSQIRNNNLNVDYVNSIKLGSYLIDYEVTDKGKTVNTFRRVNIVDTTKPVLSCFSCPEDKTFELSAGDKFNYSMIKVTDNDPDSILEVVPTGRFSTSNLGTYEITYIATDNSNNTGSLKLKIKTVSPETYILTLLKGAGIDKIYCKLEDQENFESNDYNVIMGVNDKKTIIYYATATTGYTLNTCNEANPCSVTINGNSVYKELKAIPNKYSLIISGDSTIDKIGYKLEGESIFTESTTSLTTSVNYNSKYYYYGIAKEGYKLDNCSKSDPCIGTKDIGETSIILSADVSNYTITYNLNGGEMPLSGAPLTYTYGVGATITGIPTKSGYLFDGWCTSLDLNNCSLSPTITSTDFGDKKFHAKWSNYTIADCSFSGSSKLDGELLYLNGNGILTCAHTLNVDFYAVGGGGGGGGFKGDSGGSGFGTSGWRAAGGGGGGYTATVKGVTLNRGENYTVTIGPGGAGGAGRANGSTGGTTKVVNSSSANIISAAGGYGGQMGYTGSGKGAGGAGTSGGGGGSMGGAAGAGGSNGANGKPGYNESTSLSNAGTGVGASTNPGYPFFDKSYAGTIYGGGGGGGAMNKNNTKKGTAGAGGTTGGGKGGYKSSTAAAPGTANTGGGGGGAGGNIAEAQYDDDSKNYFYATGTSVTGGKGGSGVVIVRIAK